MRNELVTVADAKDRRFYVENLWVNVRATRLVDTTRTTRDNDAPSRAQDRTRCVAWLNIRVHTEFAYAPRNKVRILTAGVEHRDLRSRYEVMQT
jgi:hypothetical protein